MRISDWSSDVCSSDLRCGEPVLRAARARRQPPPLPRVRGGVPVSQRPRAPRAALAGGPAGPVRTHRCVRTRSEEHTSEPPSLTRTPYSVLYLKKTHICTLAHKDNTE